MKTKILFLLIIAFAIAQAVFGQITITGTVKSVEDGAPIPGVSINEKGTSHSAISDMDGKFQINVAGPESVLVFTFIGYNTQEITVGTQTQIDVSLELDAETVEEVVVVGYGVSSGESSPSSGIINDIINSRRERKLAKELSGKTSGVQINNSNNNVGASNNIVIRGVGTINSNQSEIASPDGFKKIEKQNQLTDDGSGNESYNTIQENEFVSVVNEPLSTFSIDVDKASYSNIRRYINNGSKPPKDAVRIEEMINYFNYEYPEPNGEHPIGLYTEIAACPWQPEHKLLHIGLQGKRISDEKLPPSNIVFLIDVSGSMQDEKKLPLLKEAFKLLVNNLRENDKVSIVVYAGAAGQVLAPTYGHKKETIIAALDNLQAGGSTAGGAGIQLAYKIAKENFIENGNNRVILATDGDFNVGASSDNEMERLIEEKRKDGIFLTCLGFGMGNYKDSKMETLADKGNGNYAYIDNIEEAKKTLVSEFGATLFTIAKDVKLQIEFNPVKVKSYRLIGYENRMLNDEDFNNDAKDAGEMGAGHSVTALYEIIPADPEIKDESKDVDDLRYQSKDKNKIAETSGELANLKIRYKQPKNLTSVKFIHPILDLENPIEKCSDTYRFSASVALFGMLLRDSQYAKGLDYKTVLELASNAKGDDKGSYRKEFIDMVKRVQ
jgi:Ca-activated chloride channel family protein